MLWTAEVSVPFSYAASKNHIWTMAGTHVYSRKESVSFRDDLAAALRKAVNGRAVPGWLWLDIFVQKPDHKGDAVNVVDLVCDAAKDATGVDDRWYSILRLDWEIRKTDPMLWVRVGQESSEPMRVCALCGEPRTFDVFMGAGRTHMGRECRDCRRVSMRAPRKDGVVFFDDRQVVELTATIGGDDDTIGRTQNGVGLSRRGLLAAAAGEGETL